MRSNLFQFVSHEQQPFGKSRSESKPAASDARLLDAYSQAVIAVVESAGPAVVSVTGYRGGRPAGSGSAFLVTPDGYAITNSHVIEGHDTFIAETVDGDRIDATLVGDDPATDLALLRLASNGLAYVELGDSDAAGAVGDRHGKSVGIAVDRVDRRGECHRAEHAWSRWTAYR
jgi:S1-C subfamily serine protease